MRAMYRVFGRKESKGGGLRRVYDVPRIYTLSALFFFSQGQTKIENQTKGRIVCLCTYSLQVQHYLLFYIGPIFIV